MTADQPANAYDTDRVRHAISNQIKLYSDRVVIDVAPLPKPNHDWGDFKYRVIVDTDAGINFQEDLDTPITLTDSDAKEPAFDLETDDAELLAWALIRAVQVRRDFIASLNSPAATVPR